jgi:phospholipase C
MGYYARDDIPFHFALAESFTVCDNYFSSLFGPTWPNRLFWMTGTIDAAGGNGGPIIDNVAPADGYGWTTYAERLESAGVPWKVYQEDDNYGTNLLCRFSRFQAAPKRSGLAGRAMVVDQHGRFEYDAMHDRLPAVSWILPTGYQCEHPDFTPADGAAYIASKIDAIAANPDVWAKTVFILSYDENDGCSTTYRRPRHRRGRTTNSSTECRRARDSGCRASSYRRGPRATGCAASRSTTPHNCVSWNASPVCGNRISAAGDDAHSAI